jgi:hypothetical protein
VTEVFQAVASFTFFHSCPISLGLGSVIEPGNWGRIIDLYTLGDAGPSGTIFVAYRETVLESYRRERCLAKPSRLKGLFGCPDEQTIRAYHAAHTPRNVIYEVETIEDGPTHHQGDYMLAVFPPQMHPQMQYVREFPLRAAEYWSDTHPKLHPEILVGCAVRVRRRL